MSRQHPAVMPSDFAEVAIGMSQPQAAAHYGLSVWQVIRMMREMTPEWRAKYREGWRARTAESATRNLNRYRAQFAANKAPDDKRKGPGPQTRPMPEGFYEFILHNSQDAACKQYRTSEKTIQRWKALLDPDQRKAVKAGIQERYAERMSRLHAGRNRFNGAKPKSDKAPAKKPRAASWGTNKLSAVPSVGADHAAMAAQHLRRHYRTVYRGDVYSKHLAGLYVVGSMKLTQAEMIALAQSKGWQPGAFLQVAA